MTILSISLPAMEAIAQSTFSDTCDIHTPTITYSSLREQSKTFSTNSNVPCGFNPANGNTKFDGQIVTLEYDAILRLPLTQSLNDNQEITCRGTRFNIYGITVGRTVKVVTLKKVSPDE